MPLYENRANAENVIRLSREASSSLVCGSDSVFDTLVSLLLEKASAGCRCLAIDGWYGVDFGSIANGFLVAAKARKLDVELVPSAAFFQEAEAIDQYQKIFETDDPSFGRVNSDGELTDVIDPSAVERLAARLKARSSGLDVLLVFGPGAAVEPLTGLYDFVAYADFTMQPLLWQMWDGKLIPFGRQEPVSGYAWKKYYYCDFYLLYRHKKKVLEFIDCYIDAVDPKALKLLSAGAYNEMIDELVKQPIKQVKILQPGPWGAYRYKDLWQVDGLECNAWNQLAGIELSVLVDVGGQAMINIPTQNLMQRPIQMVGEYVHHEFPDLLPLQVWLDDGYFPEPVGWERSSMPIHDHPDTDYVKRHFNEPLGRYETYYIVESYKNSSTWMGYKEDANLEEWERLCRDSQNLKVIPNWEDYVCRWDSNVGDLFLIPPGTSHGHGGNQMILEMDTGPSVAGTEYSFFTYDFARKTWDDKNKSMTEKPMKMHLEHSFANQRWIREERVKNHHRARPITIDGNGKVRRDRYTSLPQMPFHIERIFMEETAEADTEGRFMQIVTLTEGQRVTIESIEHPEYRTSIERLQSCILPAGLGKHRYINETGRHAMVVLIRLKNG